MRETALNQVVKMGDARPIGFFPGLGKNKSVPVSPPRFATILKEDSMSDNSKKQSQAEAKSKVSRRKFLAAAAATAGGAAIGVPMIASAKKMISLRFQSTW